jgi:cell division protease FtsH
MSIKYFMSINKKDFFEKIRHRRVAAWIKSAEFSHRIGAKFENLADYFNGRARKIAPEIIESPDKINTLYHEAGHAYLCVTLPGNGKLLVYNAYGSNFNGEKEAKGFIAHTTEEPERADRKTLLNVIAMTMGGLCAEEILHGKDAFGGGVLHDLRSATELARRMINEFGMSELGTVTLSDSRSARFSFLGLGFDLPFKIHDGMELSEKTKQRREELIKEIIDNAKEIATAELCKNWHIVEAIVAAGKQKTILTGDEVRQIIAESSAKVQTSLE